MGRIILFLLGKKGLAILNATLSTGNRASLYLVVIGQDENMAEDYSGQILETCMKHNINYCYGTEYKKLQVAPKECIAIAGGWRWLLDDNFKQLIVFHDSLLPKCRGFNPLVTALVEKHPAVGVTAIIASDRYDCGDIVAQKKIIVDYPTKIGTVIDRVASLYYEVQIDILEKLKYNSMLQGSPQNEEDASYSIWRDEEDYRIDWNKSADDIAHFIRCVSFPYRGATSEYDGQLVRIKDATVISDVTVENRQPGKVIFVDNTKPIVICGIGLLRLEQVEDCEENNLLPFRYFRTRLR